MISRSNDVHLNKTAHTKNNTNINFKVTKSFRNFYTLLLFRAQFYFSIYFSEKWVAKTRFCFQNEKSRVQSNALFWLGDFVTSPYRYVYPFVIFYGKFVAAEEMEKKTDKDTLCWIDREKVEEKDKKKGKTREQRWRLKKSKRHFSPKKQWWEIKLKLWKPLVYVNTRFGSIC